MCLENLANVCRKGKGKGNSAQRRQMALCTQRTWMGIKYLSPNLCRASSSGLHTAAAGRALDGCTVELGRATLVLAKLLQQVRQHFGSLCGSGSLTQARRPRNSQREEEDDRLRERGEKVGLTNNNITPSFVG